MERTSHYRKRPGQPRESAVAAHEAGAIGTASRPDGTSAGEDGRAAISLGSIEGRLGYHIRRLQVWVFQDFIRTLSVIDIRPAQYSVLAVIGANPGLSQTEVSAALGIERARLVRLLDRLEKRGLVLRRPAARDRRSHALELTEEGTAILAQADRLADEHEKRLIEHIGPGLHESLLAAIRKSPR